MTMASATGGEGQSARGRKGKGCLSKVFARYAAAKPTSGFSAALVRAKGIGGLVEFSRPHAEGTGDWLRQVAGRAG
jgi:hypothetical protein